MDQPHFLLGTEPALTLALPQHQGSRRTQISAGSGSSKPVLGTAPQSTLFYLFI